MQEPDSREPAPLPRQPCPYEPLPLKLRVGNATDEPASLPQYDASRPAVSRVVQHIATSQHRTVSFRVPPVASPQQRLPRFGRAVAADEEEKTTGSAAISVSRSRGRNPVPRDPSASIQSRSRSNSRARSQTRAGPRGGRSSRSLDARNAGRLNRSQSRSRSRSREEVSMASVSPARADSSSQIENEH